LSEDDAGEHHRVEDEDIRDLLEVKTNWLVEVVREPPEIKTKPEIITELKTKLAGDP
jgi:hypothetical protein